MEYTFPHAQVDKVTDGDSFYANLAQMWDFGFHVKILGQSRQKFRLDGCNAAPLKTLSGKGAAARMTELLILSGNLVTIESLGPYKFGDEWMAKVTLATGEDLATLMIKEQWSAPWTGAGTAPLPPWPRSVS